MVKSGWDREEFIKGDSLPEYFWHKGFFPFEWDYSLWKRNFSELRFRDLAVFAMGPLENKKILDVGCGYEALYLLTFLKQGAASVSGQDISEKVVQNALKESKKNNFTCDIRVGDCAKLQFPDNSFDLVFSGDVFEHITDQQKMDCIREIFRVLKPGGTVTIKTPNLDYLRMTIAIKRLLRLFKLKNPFSIHIAHTKNNPNNEHHGLTTYKKLSGHFIENTFHDPAITYTLLRRKFVPMFLSKLFLKNKYFNEHIIMTATKPVFFGIYH